VQIIITIIEPCDPSQSGDHLYASFTSIIPLPFIEVSAATSRIDEKVSFQGGVPDSEMPEEGE